MSSNHLVVERARQEHVSAIAKIHYRSLRNDFLPSLGQEFLQQTYYPAALKSQNAATFIALYNTQPTGFVTVAHDSNRFTHDIFSGRLLLLAVYALRAAIKNPLHLKKSLEVLWSVTVSKPDPIKGEIVFIAVSEAHRAQGIGKGLLTAAQDYLCEKGVKFIRTKTLAQNIDVIGMYEKRGWQVRNHFRFLSREYVTIVSPPIC